MSSHSPSTPSVRIGDSDRDDARRLLNEHLSAGRLTPEELGERAVQAAVARTRDELWALFRDLPPPRPEFDARPVASAPQDRTARRPRSPRVPITGAFDWSYPVLAVAAPCALLGAGVGLLAAFENPIVLFLAIVTVGVTYLALVLADPRGTRRSGADRSRGTGQRS